MTTHDIAWVAGFFDGEGHCGLHSQQRANNNTYNAHVSITNTNREILMTIYRMVGLGDLSDTNKGTATSKRKYQLWFPVPHQVKFLKLIQPYLKLKARQVELVIEYHETCKADPSGFTKTITETQLSRREAIYEELRVLNARG